jgi:hypothetical protein
MARTKKMSLAQQLAHRGFESASVARTLHDGSMEVQANVLCPLPIGGDDPVFAFVPVTLTVAVDKSGEVRILTGEAPSDDCIADATRFVRTLRDNGQIADDSDNRTGESQREARAAPGVTHEIRRDDRGRRIFQRRRFSAV